MNVPRDPPEGSGGSVRRGGTQGRRSRTSRPRRVVERRRAAQRRRRLLVLTLLLVTATIAGVDFAAGGLTRLGRDVRAQPQRSTPASPSPSSESPSPSPSASPSPSRKPYVPRSGTGKFTTATGGTGVVGRGGDLLRYRVRVERGLRQDPAEFADFVDATLADGRSWIAGGDVRFRRVDSGPYDFTVFLTSPAATDRLCAPLPTNGYTSCRQGDNVVINLARWLLGVPQWDAELDSYRQYAVNHEVGHRLGHGHEVCPRKGKPAPVMQQQTLKLAGCTGNAWPYLNGRRYTGPPGSYA